MIKNQENIEKLATKWYSALDTHEPIEKFYSMLSKDNLKMVFPEATLEGLDGFKGWYDGVIRIFFDEVHKVESVKILDENNKNLVTEVIVRWEASRWIAPEAYSERIMLLAYQTWKVDISVQNNPLISEYTVDRLEYLSGSVEL